MSRVSYYSPLEEKINIRSHAAGFALSLIGTAIIVNKAIEEGTTLHALSFLVFGLGSSVLYLASTLYHSATVPEKRARLKIFDHAAIYIMIASGYTPFALIAIGGKLGTSVLTFAWSTAIAGIALKLIFTGKFKKTSTLLYLAMGWAVLFTVEPIENYLEPSGFNWLVAGGISYTLGAILYSIKKVPFNHALFHGFVLFGNFSHFHIAYYYLIK